MAARPIGRAFLCAAALLCGVLVPAAAQSASSRGAKSEPRALLVRGSSAVKGLPHFGENALPAVSGEYRLLAFPDAPRLRVWMTREPLYLSGEAWSPARLSGRAAREARGGYADEEGAYRLFLFDRPFAAVGQGAVPGEWTVLIALPAAGDAAYAAAAERFAAVFLDRLSYFLSSARAPEDASFPAVLNW